MLAYHIVIVLLAKVSKFVTFLYKQVFPLVSVATLFCSLVCCEEESFHYNF